MWYKKRNKMDITSVVLCGLVILLAQQSVVAHDKNVTSENDRYPKDDGVAKLGFESSYDQSEERDDKTHFRNTQIGQEDVKKPGEVEIIEERKEIPKIVDVKTTQSEELNDMVTSEINRSALLKELANSLAGKSGALRSSKSTSQELRGKEKRLIPLEDVDSSSSETRALKQQGVPFFIADDGKSIQLPQSDVIYNTETGEILIRNRVTADKMKAEADMASAEVKSQSNKNGYFNIRPDGIGFKNLQGFVIADNVGSPNRPLLYPIAEDSKESGSHEVHLRRKGMESEERKANEGRKNLQDADEKKEAIGTLFAATEAPPKISDEALFHVDNKNVSSTDGKAINDLILADLQKSLIVSPVSETTTQKSIEETKKDIVFNTPDENNRSPKQVSSNSNSNEKTREQQSNEKSSFPIEQMNHFAFRSDEEPIYKISTTTESTVIANRFGNPEDHYFNGQGYIRPDIVVSNVDEQQQHNNKYNSGESKTRPAEYKHKTFLEEDHQQNNSIKKVAHEEIIQKSNTNQEKIDEILAKPTSYDVDRTLVTNEEILKRIAEEMIIVNTNPGIAKMSYTTTTEQPDPLMVLRGYLEDIYLRGPIAIVVDVEAKNLMKTRDVWTSMEAYGGNLNITDAVLFGYDDNGITSMSYHKGLGANRVDNDDKSLAKALYGMTATSKYTSSAGNPGVALNKAVHLLPYDSAVFLFEGAARAEPLSQPGPSPRLIKQLLTKRIKLYTVSSPSAWSASAALASGGAALSLTGTSRSQARPNQRELRALSVYYDSSDEEELVFDEQQTLLIYNEVVEPKTFRFPVDSSITTLTVTLSETPQVASLEGPRGIQIDLLDEVSVTNYSAGSVRSSGDPGGLTATLQLVRASPILEEELLGQSEPYQGTWKLIILSNVAYDVSVTADTPLRIMAKLIPTYPEHGPEVQTIKIAVGGTVASIEDGDILDATGRNITKLVYGNPDDNSESDATEIESLRALESGTIVKRVGVPEVLTPGTVFRVQVEGKNDRDEEFVRVSAPLTAPDNYDAETISTVLPASGVLGKQMVLERGVGSIEEGRAFNSTPSGQQVMLTVQDGVPMTAIQIGSSSRLYGTPGAQIQIHFEVTNNRENAVYFRFGAKDDQYFLRSMLPLRQWINAGQTANVVVTVGITSSAENNVRDTITFTANGLEPANLSTYVYVETDGRITSDRSRPSLKHEFRGDCQGYLGSDCATRTWGLDIIAKDTDSGLMRIGASPGTVVYPSGHYAGGREESRARYTASCCQQTVVISAVDVAGNIASYEVNVSQYFTPATIAAIVLGVLLFIALVVVIALLIRMCIKRRRASRDLPSYSTQRATRTTTP